MLTNSRLTCEGGPRIPHSSVDHSPPLTVDEHQAVACDSPREWSGPYTELCMGKWQWFPPIGKPHVGEAEPSMSMASFIVSITSFGIRLASEPALHVAK